MGHSVKYILVFNNNVLEVPMSKLNKGKFINPELSNQNVLKIEMIYETNNRKPYNIIRILFDRINFDKNGVYYMDDSLTEENSIKLEYVMYSINSELIDPQPLPIPKAPIIPSKGEIEIIKGYLTKKYPFLLNNSPNALEYWIKRSKEIYEEDLRKFKDSHKKSN
jgi:hypothetical protein